MKIDVPLTANGFDVTQQIRDHLELLLPDDLLADFKRLGIRDMTTRASSGRYSVSGVSIAFYASYHRGEMRRVMVDKTTRTLDLDKVIAKVKELIPLYRKYVADQDQDAKHKHDIMVKEHDLTARIERSDLKFVDVRGGGLYISGVAQWPSAKQDSLLFAISAILK